MERVRDRCRADRSRSSSAISRGQVLHIECERHSEKCGRCEDGPRRLLWAIWRNTGSDRTEPLCKTVWSGGGRLLRIDSCVHPLFSCVDDLPHYRVAAKRNVCHSHLAQRGRAHSQRPFVVYVCAAGSRNRSRSQKEATVVCPSPPPLPSPPNEGGAGCLRVHEWGGGGSAQRERGHVRRQDAGCSRAERCELGFALRCVWAGALPRIADERQASVCACCSLCCVRVRSGCNSGGLSLFELSCSCDGGVHSDDKSVERSERKR
mmetsp:Transcript_25337/g.63559  ORF Transcript_25337/g.63559 Transcript_25337/m.63559 type:complete len:263 (+) Transcript_25337:1105-1893(+)